MPLLLPACAMRGPNGLTGEIERAIRSVPNDGATCCVIFLRQGLISAGNTKDRGGPKSTPWRAEIRALGDSGRHNWQTQIQFDEKIWKTQAFPVDLGSTEPDGASELFATRIEIGPGCDGAHPGPRRMPLRYKPLRQPIDCIALAVADDMAVNPKRDSYIAVP